jgi:hypothetical protein
VVRLPRLALARRLREVLVRAVRAAVEGARSALRVALREGVARRHAGDVGPVGAVSVRRDGAACRRRVSAPTHSNQSAFALKRRVE